MIKTTSAPIAVGLALTFAAAAAISWPVIGDEQASTRAEAATAADPDGPPPLPWATPAVSDCGQDCPARAQAANGARLAQQAGLARDALARVTLAGQARQRLARALAARPASGDWWAWAAYADLLHSGVNQDTIADLEQSYRRSPYVLHLAAWRIGLCARLWPRLDRFARQSAVDEMVWLRDVDPQSEQQILDQVDDPAAAIAFAQALRQPAASLVPHRRGRGPGGIGLIG